MAYHLINAFLDKGISILQILARNERSGRALSENFNIPCITDPEKLNREADLYILAVQDDQIMAAAHSLKLRNQLLVHTSGYTPLEILSGSSANTGVIWPLQTLTEGREADYHQIPVFVEGNTKENEEMLVDFMSLISNHVGITDSPTRRQIHLAAVIASNLTNHLYTISASLLEKADVPFDVLVPLINETAGKTRLQHPRFNQTGPAARKDFQVIEKHLEMLKDEPAYREIYRLLTENIIQHHSK